VERCLRDSKSFQVLARTPNIQKIIIARHILAD
jgi:alkylation response protein AidB-like acyl-CoA dehydrogenase